MSIYQELKKIASANNIKVASPKDDAMDFVNEIISHDGVHSAHLEAFMKHKEFKDIATHFKQELGIDLKQ